MTAPHADDIIRGYLARLSVALGETGSGTRSEIQSDVESHIAEARAVLVDESDADILNLLDRLGEPSILAAEAGGEPSRQAVQRVPDATPKSAIVAVGLLVFGSFLGFILGPLILAILVVALLIARTSGQWAGHEVAIAGLLPFLVMTGLVLAWAIFSRNSHLAVFLLLVGSSVSLLPSAVYLGWTATRSRRAPGRTRVARKPLGCSTSSEATSRTTRPVLPAYIALAIIATWWAELQWMQLTSSRVFPFAQGTKL